MSVSCVPSTSARPATLDLGSGWLIMIPGASHPREPTLGFPRLRWSDYIVLLYFAWFSYGWIVGRIINALHRRQSSATGTSACPLLLIFVRPEGVLLRSYPILAMKKQNIKLSFYITFRVVHIPWNGDYTLEKTVFNLYRIFLICELIDKLITLLQNIIGRYVERISDTGRYIYLCYTYYI